MKKTLIYIVTVVLGIVIVGIILGDFLWDERDETVANPYAYRIDEYKAVPPELIKYKEIKRVGLNLADPRAIDIYGDKIAIGFKQHLQVIDTAGIEFMNRSLRGPVSALSYSPRGVLFIAFQNNLEIIDSDGNTVDQWDSFTEGSIITSIAFKGDTVFIADAGSHTVYRYNVNGDKTGSFDGTTGRLEGNYGFILPSPYFDLEVDPYDQLWVVNPGLLKVENYTFDGTLRAYWGKPSFEIEGFTGCCNPAQMAILPDGSFVTSEKGLPRIKVYKPSGELDGVVMAPAGLAKDEEPADLAIDGEGRIYALDISQKRIRVFERFRN